MTKLCPHCQSEFACEVVDLTDKCAVVVDVRSGIDDRALGKTLDEAGCKGIVIIPSYTAGAVVGLDEKAMNDCGWFSKAQVDELREALTIWCSECCNFGEHPPPDARPAVVSFDWSDRGPAGVCMEHVPKFLASMAQDHYYDRGGMNAHFDIITQPSILKLPRPDAKAIEHVINQAREAACVFLDATFPSWINKTLWFDAAQEAAFIERVRVALDVSNTPRQ